MFLRTFRIHHRFLGERGSWDLKTVSSRLGSSTARASGQEVWVLNVRAFQKSKVYSPVCFFLINCIPMIVELNGFDESGQIGEDLRFIRVGIDAHNELRPFIYNLLHFGSLVMTKKMLRGQYSEVQKEYVRAILNDPAIALNHYVFPPELQLKLLKHFTCCELNRIADKRRELLYVIENTQLKETASKIVDYFRKYNDPWGYVERFIKSYGFKMIIENLSDTSRVSRNRTIEEFYKIICLVDGGNPLVFWRDEYLELKRKDILSSRDFSIFGITNGDEYYPIINLAGNVATITNRFYEMIYPQNVERIAYPNDFPLDDYCKTYEKRCSKPWFYSRILFIGNVEANLQYSIPFIHYKINKHRIFEPLRVSYKPKGSFRSFYKWFRGRSDEDLVIFGKIETAEEKEMYEESEGYGLKMVDVATFLDSFQGLLNDIRNQANGTSLDKLSLQKIDSKLGKIEAICKKKHTKILGGDIGRDPLEQVQYVLLPLIVKTSDTLYKAYEKSLYIDVLETS